MALQFDVYFAFVWMRWVVLFFTGIRVGLSADHHSVNGEVVAVDVVLAGKLHVPYNFPRRYVEIKVFFDMECFFRLHHHGVRRYESVRASECFPF